jgi:DNA-binding NarL/FixJ family response regulator
MNCRILLADRHDVVRVGLRAVLSSLGNVTVCGEAVDGIDAIQKAHQLNPDIVIAEHGLPKANGVIVTQRLREQNSKVKVLIFETIESTDIIRDLLRVGIKGLVSKADSGSDIVQAIEALQRNRTYFTRSVELLILDGYLRPGKFANSEPSDVRLSLRELEVLQLLAEGNPCKEIAGVLGMSVKTAETHRSNITRKLGSHNLAQTTLYAISHHIVEAPLFLLPSPLVVGTYRGIKPRREKRQVPPMLNANTESYSSNTRFEAGPEAH